MHIQTRALSQNVTNTPLHLHRHASQVQIHKPFVGIKSCILKGSQCMLFASTSNSVMLESLGTKNYLAHHHFITITHAKFHPCCKSEYLTYIIVSRFKHRIKTLLHKFITVYVDMVVLGFI